jgi:hypothetical protein
MRPTDYSDEDRRADLMNDEAMDALKQLGEEYSDEHVPVSHCDGCDQDEPDVKEYRIKTRGGPGTWERARYCSDCAGLAKADWSGTIEAIEEVPPISPDSPTIEDMNAEAWSDYHRGLGL